MTRQSTIYYLQGLLEVLEQGCSNHGCAINKKNVGGQGTNSVCQCKPTNIARELERVAKWLNESDRMKWEE
jgi:hypothetical protein